MTGQSYGYGDPGSTWRPAPFCSTTTEARLTVDGPDLVDVAYTGWYGALFGDVAVLPAEAGFADARPLRLLQVQTSPDVTEVAVVWPDGASDRTAVVDGVAVLVVDGSNPWDGWSLEITDGSGTRTVTVSDLDHLGDPDYRAACVEPPPALPDAGEQPADRAAAEAALRARFDLLWARTVSADDKPDDLLDDRTGVDAAIAQVFEGPYAAVAESATRTIDELVFTSPTEAWFRYGIDSDNGYFGPRYGTATLTNGVWVFPRALVCQDIGLAGGACDPWADDIYPPSWYARWGGFGACYETEDGGQVCNDGAAVDSVFVPSQTTILVPDVAPAVGSTQPGPTATTTSTTTTTTTTTSPSGG
jgi:hypothetical protein